MRIVLDTSVLLDVLAKRELFCRDSAGIWSLAERGAIEGLVSVISFNNIYYVVRRATEQALRLMRNVFASVPLNAQVLGQAIDAGFNDFEDAIQFHSAVHAVVEYLVTRDAVHFPAAHFPILSPLEFLATQDPG